MTFFEIDPIVIEVASDPTLLHLPRGRAIRPAVIEGDARLSFADQPDWRFDMLVMDAFSSDSIPVHLLTAEAIRDEIRTLAPDGLVVFHVSNRYYDLTPPIAAAVRGARASPILASHTHPVRPRARGDTIQMARGLGGPIGTSRLARTRVGTRSRRPTTRSATTTRTCCGTSSSVPRPGGRLLDVGRLRPQPHPRPDAILAAMTAPTLDAEPACPGPAPGPTPTRRPPIPNRCVPSAGRSTRSLAKHGTAWPRKTRGRRRSPHGHSTVPGGTPTATTPMTRRSWSVAARAPRPSRWRSSR